MLNKFKTNIELLVAKTDKVLIAVSGGLDSVVLSHLSKNAQLNFGIAHCNFKLREKDADADELFVNDLASNLEVKFHVKQFQTKKYAQDNKLSTQEAARNLRYKWFQELCTKHGYKYIFTAHHKNDSVETVIHNLTRGTGLKGLHGILQKNNNLIRPLLIFTKSELSNFAKSNNIRFRVDKSNFNNKYTRNHIRNNVLPMLEAINVNVVENIYKSSLYVKQTEELLFSKIEDDKKELFVKLDDYVKAEIDQLKKKIINPTHLFYLLKDYGVNTDNVRNINNLLDSISGKKVATSTHVFLKNRNNLIIYNLDANKANIKNTFRVCSVEDLATLPIKISFDKIKPDNNIVFKSSTAFLDANKFDFPFVLRKWKEGDFFKPLGMKSNKKLSDFFIDNKLSIKEKEQVWLIEKEGEIVWIVNHRIHDDYKISHLTKEVIKLECNI